MNLFFKIIVFLINIDQESVLNFFGIQDPNAVVNADYQSIFEPARTFTPLSFETLRIIAESVLDHYKRGGLDLIAIENICLFILFIRFIVLAFKYNVKTSFYICCISLGAALLWYLHIRDLLLMYQGSINLFKVQILKGAMQDYRMERTFDTDRDVEFAISYKHLLDNKLGGRGIEFDEYNTTRDFLGVKLATVASSERDGYRIDPVSMIFARMPDFIKPATDRIYYTLIMKFLPQFWISCIRTVKSYFPLMLWVYFTRVQKRYCPYLIRWHWTYIITLDWFERPFINLGYRMFIYARNVIIPLGKVSEIVFVQSLMTSVITVHVMFLLYGLLHAIFSQYFYIPFLTEATELHIGPRPTDSIYSGGYTDWQDFLEMRLGGYDQGGYVPKKLWFGWLGTDRQLPQKFNRFFGKSLKNFRKFFRKLRKLFFK